jgi:hypothetical protein
MLLRCNDDGNLMSKRCVHCRLVLVGLASAKVTKPSAQKVMFFSQRMSESVLKLRDKYATVHEPIQSTVNKSTVVSICAPQFFYCEFCLRIKLNKTLELVIYLYNLPMYPQPILRDGVTSLFITMYWLHDIVRYSCIRNRISTRHEGLGAKAIDAKQSQNQVKEGTARTTVHQEREDCEIHRLSNNVDMYPV